MTPATSPDGPADSPPWSLDDGLTPEHWTHEILEALRDLEQGSLVSQPPLLFAADSANPIHPMTAAWAAGESADTGAVNVRAAHKRPPYGLIITQTCDLVEVGRPKRPWFHVAPVYKFAGPLDQRRMILRERGLDYLVPIESLGATEDQLWVADLR